MTSISSRHRAVAAVLVTLAAVASVLTSATTGAAASLQARRPINDRFFMVGDSITHLGADNLRRLGVRWRIIGVSGRLVSRLPDLLQSRLAAGPAPRVVVVALGANADPGWHEANYRAAVAMLPASTRVVFVSVYRNPAIYRSGVTPFRRNPNSPYEYSKAMLDIAGQRPHTCVVPWRAWASAHRNSLAHGVHPRGHGQEVWARMVRNTVRGCH